jgi:conjugal transfer pilus assembly protein TraV
MTDMRRTFAPCVTVIATLLGGCASTLSGLGGEGDYACKAPVGSQCTSVSGVYANSIHGQPPDSVLPKPAKGPVKKPPAATVAASASATTHALPTPASAIRSQPRVLRLWIAPWEDDDGDLHEAAVVHVLIDTGRWLIERVVPVNRTRLGAVRPPSPSTAPTSGPASTSEPAPSAEAGPDRFPPRTRLMRGNGATEEP